MHPVIRFLNSPYVGAEEVKFEGTFEELYRILEGKVAPEAIDNWFRTAILTEAERNRFPQWKGKGLLRIVPIR